MKSILFLATIFLLISCGNDNEGEASNYDIQDTVGTEIENTTKDSSEISEIDYKVGLRFIGEYVNFCNSKTTDQDMLSWVNSSELATEDFKSYLQDMVEQAEKDDPNLGLDYDPIFNAQDYPEEGFVIDLEKSEGTLMTVRGIEWESFTVEIRLKKINEMWLVDGAGDVNPIVKN